MNKVKKKRRKGIIKKFKTKRSRTISPEENCPQTLKQTLTLTLTERQSSSGEVARKPKQKKWKDKLLC